MHAHGGYLIKLESLDVGWLAAQALVALEADAPGERASLVVSAVGDGRLLRLAFDGRFASGRRAARWYGEHHALARQLSRHLTEVVHTYVFVPDMLERVITFGSGHVVGGDQVDYDDVDVDVSGDEGEQAYERLVASWPLGHLGTVLGVSRELLMQCDRLPAVHIDLEEPPDGPLWQLLPVMLKGPSAPLAF